MVACLSPTAAAPLVGAEHCGVVLTCPCHRGPPHGRRKRGRHPGRVSGALLGIWDEGVSATVGRPAWVGTRGAGKTFLDRMHLGVQLAGYPRKIYRLLGKRQTAVAALPMPPTNAKTEQIDHQ